MNSNEKLPILPIHKLDQLTWRLVDQLALRGQNGIINRHYEAIYLNSLRYRLTNALTNWALAQPMATTDWSIFPFLSFLKNYWF